MLLSMTANKLLLAVLPTFVNFQGREKQKQRGFISNLNIFWGPFQKIKMPFLFILLILMLILNLGEWRYD